jgi:hypothetical protein
MNINDVMQVATHKDFQQPAKDKKLNINQWEAHLIEFKFCQNTRPDPQFQKAKAHHSVLISYIDMDIGKSSSTRSSLE